MNAATPPERLRPAVDQAHLEGLEEEAIFILREVAASFERPALLFSGGKDSCAVRGLARRLARRPGQHARFGGTGPRRPPACRTAHRRDRGNRGRSPGRPGLRRRRGSRSGRGGR